LKDLIDPLERQINEQQQQYFGEGESVSVAERAMEEVAVKVESVPVAVQATAKVAAKGAADTSKQVSQTKGATENYLKRPASPLPNERTRSKRIKSASSSMVVSDKGSVRVPQESIKQRSDFMFNQRFKELEEFKAEFGHCNVPVPNSSLSTKKNAPLENWCGQMRGSYKAFNEGRKQHIALCPERIQRLENIGFEFSSRVSKEFLIFYQRLKELEEFKAEFGHCKVPGPNSSLSTKKNASLRDWCGQIRGSYKAFKEGRKQYIALCPERIQRLENIGFDFSNSVRKRKLTFNQGLKKLEEFKAEFGHCKVPAPNSSLSTKKNDSFENWYCQIRGSYKAFKEGRKHQIALCPERIQQLENIGFEFRNSVSKNDLKFNRRLKELEEFKAEFGHCNVSVPKSSASKCRQYQSLSDWCRQMRSSYKAFKEGSNHMCPERIQRLENIGFEWSQVQPTFNQRLEEFKAELFIFDHKSE
jgi:hypothetical protein